MSVANRRPYSADCQSLFKRRMHTDDDAELTESLIISARNTGQLNLSSKGLSTVPTRVWTINDLSTEEKLHTNLNFDENKERWWEFEPLKTLNISSNNLKELDSQVGSLVELEDLDLHNNALEALPPEIGTLNKLRNLNIASNKIQVLPLDLYKLTELRILNIGNNLLKEIHPSVGDLVMLEYMNLSCNNLTELPVGLGYLVRLVCLDISHNMLPDLPPDLTSMRALKKLDAGFNQLEVLPSMGELHRMEILILHTNNLSRSPNTNGCTSLRELHIDNNKISSIDVPSLESMTQLKILTCANNEIESIPEEIMQLCNLERLDLSNNKIDSIPVCIGHMPKLRTFLIDGNNIRNVRRDVIQCGTPRLQRFLREIDHPNHAQRDFSHSPCSAEFTDFPDKYVMRNTRALNLSNRNLCDIPESVTTDASGAEVLCIDLCKNKFKQLPDVLSVVTALKELKVMHNQLSTLPDWIGEKYQYLQFLDISNNYLLDLPESISTLNYLRELNISYNRYTVIPKCIYDLIGLEILIASNNKIENIDVASLSGLKRLANLDISNNNIAYVPPELGNMKHLRVLELSGNCFKQPRYTTLAKGTEEILAYLRDRISI